MSTPAESPGGSVDVHAETTAMAVAEHIAVVAAEGQRFADAAGRGPWEAQVAGCPGWSMRDLVRHLSEIHLWAAANVARRPGAKLDLDDRSELIAPWPDLAVFWPADDELIDHYLRTNANLVGVLESAPPDLDAPTFLPAPSPLAMWARRQAHETSVHRFDAEIATGTASGFDPVFAADGVSELLYGFYDDVSRPAGREFPVDRDRTMHFHAQDTDDHWYVTIGPRSITRPNVGEPVELTVAGAASDLYLALWNRGDDATISVTGDRAILDIWHACTGVRWDLD
ncbi:MAG: maleylpyruvate isomerase family mycothiol-dependent enzyme [Actinomycetota bacterium]|nr:maleylpyruvate isomerase family mycothiol-dependent enzyme [Actinomycetota bacterium]